MKTSNPMKSLTVNQIVERFPGAQKIQIFIKTEEVKTIKGPDYCFFTAYPFMVRTDGSFVPLIDFKISIKPKWKRVMDIKDSEFWVLSIDASKKLQFSISDEDEAVEYYKTQFSFITNKAAIDSLFSAYMNLEDCEEFNEDF